MKISTHCKRPFMRSGLPFGCGQCMPCRIKRRRLWVHRNLLESRLHGDSSFLTLTYDEAHHAELGEPYSLDFRHHHNFIQTLRRKFKTNPIRYYGVGEYGERSGRPHFHYLLYGYPACSGSRCKDPRYACQACSIVRDAWGKGYIYLGDVTKDSISYVASYVTKGWTKENDFNRVALNSRVPESARMSQAIGGKAIDAIADSFINDVTFSELFLGSEGDVPSVLKTDGRLYPIGRYLKSRFRKRLGWNETNLPEDKLNEWKKEMQELYETHFKDAPFTPRDSDKKGLLQELSRDAITCIESKFKKYNLQGAL